MYFTIYRDRINQFRWRLKAANQRTIADSGEAYMNRLDCEAAIELVRNSRNSPIRDE